MRHSVEYTAFTKVVEAVLSVSREEMQRRGVEFQKHAALNPKRRSPERKIKPSAPPIQSLHPIQIQVVIYFLYSKV
jgi:acetyl-CoA acetyltransferase